MAYNENLTRQQHVLLLGAVGVPQNGNVTGDVINRSSFLHHTFQRVKMTGADPAVKIQMCIPAPSTNPSAEHWVTVATLNNTTPVVFLNHTYMPYIRAVRDDSVAGDLYVWCCSVATPEN